MSQPSPTPNVFRRLRENGPGLLVPAAWTFAILAHVGFLAERTVLIAHCVMSVLLVAFVTLSWEDMADHAVLRAWRTVILFGVPVTLAGTASFLLGGLSASLTTGLQATAVVGWLALPTWGLYRTARGVGSDELPWVYDVGAGASFAGVAVYLVGLASGEIEAILVTGLALGGIGQTAGIWLAVRAY